MARQRRDEQERHLKKKSQEDQENVDHLTPDTNKASRTRHDTANSQTFSMKSWSDQMDSFNYASLHEKSVRRRRPSFEHRFRFDFRSTSNAEHDEVPVSIDFHRSASESSSPSRHESNSRQTKPRKVKTRLIQSKQYQQSVDNSAPRTNSKRTTGHPEQPIYRPKQSTMKTRNIDRTQPSKFLLSSVEETRKMQPQRVFSSQMPRKNRVKIRPRSRGKAAATVKSGVRFLHLAQRRIRRKRPRTSRTRTNLNHATIQLNTKLVIPSRRRLTLTRRRFRR